MHYFGGISRYFVELCRGLEKRGHDVRVIAPLYFNAFLSSTDISHLVKGVHWNPHFLGEQTITAAYNRMLLPFYWRNYQPDIIHETYYPLHPTGHGKRRVVTVHDMIYDIFTGEFHDAAHVIQGKKAAVERADHVICDSRNTQNDLVRLYGIDESKTSVIYLGHTPLELERDDGPMPGERPYLLYVGDRGGYKNFRFFVMAYASSHNLKADFDLVSFGGKSFSRDELAMLSELDLDGKVRHVKGDDKLLGNCYRNATAFIFPSLFEGFGLPPLEAMYCGCPVICSNTSSIPEVVGDAGAYFDPTDICQMREVMEKVMYDTDMRNAMRLKGSERVKLFTWEKCAAETEAVYMSLL